MYGKRTETCSHAPQLRRLLAAVAPLLLASPALGSGIDLTEAGDGPAAQLSDALLGAGSSIDVDTGPTGG